MLASTVRTAFARCGMFESRLGGGRNGLPCRNDEEESCNEVHATCAREPKEGAEAPALTDDQNFYKPRPPCEPPKDTGNDAKGAVPDLKVGKAMAGKALAGKALETAKKGAGVGASIGDCNARMADMPYGLRNPEADSKGKSLWRFLTGGDRAMNQAMPMTVWGMAVHGLSGTWAFDSHGPHATDYVYELPQAKGLPSDYYLCDSRERPQQCALLGGNLRHACAEWYDPEQCDFCEDHGKSIVCSVRGWNQKYRKWSRVPIYPRDLLGELYRGEWHDVFARPMWASVELLKAGLSKPVKQLPDYMIGPGPAKSAMDKPGGPAPLPQTKLTKMIASLGSKIPGIGGFL